MGTIPKRPAGLAATLFTPVQQRVLGLLFGQPNRRFQSAELIRLAQSGTGAVHRQLQQLAAAGLVIVTRLGNQKHYQANHAAPIFNELHGIAIKTVGLVEPLQRALAPISEQIQAAFVYGSVAQGTDRASSDIDLMVVSDALTYAEVFEAVQSTEQLLARTVNPTVLSKTDWKRKRSTAESFAAKISSGPKLFVVGNDDDLA